MNAFKKVLKFENYKARHNKLLVYVGVIVLLTFILTSISYFCFIKPYEPEDINREELLFKYQNEIILNNEIIEQDKTLSKEEIENLKVTIKLYEFYINTNTIEQDYINNFNLPLERNIENSNAGFMFIFLAISGLVMCAIAGAVGVYFVSSDYKNNSIKNILAGQVSRVKLFLSKLSIHFVLMSSIFLIFIIFAMIFGLVNPSKFLFYVNENFVSVNGMAVFFMQALSLFVLMISVTSITVAVGVLSKSRMAGCGGVICLILLICMISMLGLKDSLSSPVFMVNNEFHNFPLISLIFNAGHYGLRYNLIISLHLIGCVALLWFSTWRFKKQNI